MRPVVIGAVQVVARASKEEMFRSFEKDRPKNNTDAALGCAYALLHYHCVPGFFLILHQPPEKCCESLISKLDYLIHFIIKLLGCQNASFSKDFKEFEM